MSILDQLKNYVSVGAPQDVSTFKMEYDQRLGGLDKLLLYSGGMSLNKNTMKNARNMKNTRNTRNMNVKNTTNLEEKKFRLSLLFSMIVLGSLSHLRGMTPFIHSFIELLTVYKTDAYNSVLLPFMSIMENSFTFLKSTLLPNLKEGIYLKTLNTLNGTDFLNDPNKVMTTMVNMGKINVFMVSFMAPLLKNPPLEKPYVPSVPVIKDTELQPLVADVLRVLQENDKGKKGFTYMTIPNNSVLMTPS